ncbi:hypothetical protein B0H14DRAFT_3560728 [Mycena olivaceomarginata]|nr:hypothetical protein B0H14DRAFT_3560728 [Mycena olivaceomarginata]
MELDGVEMISLEVPVEPDIQPDALEQGNDVDASEASQSQSGNLDVHGRDQDQDPGSATRSGSVVTVVTYQLVNQVQHPLDAVHVCGKALGNVISGVIGRRCSVKAQDALVSVNRSRRICPERRTRALEVVHKEWWLQLSDRIRLRGPFGKGQMADEYMAWAREGSPERKTWVCMALGGALENAEKSKNTGGKALSSIIYRYLLLSIDIGQVIAESPILDPDPDPVVRIIRTHSKKSKKTEGAVAPEPSDPGKKTRKPKAWSVRHTDDHIYTLFKFLAQFPEEYRALYGDTEPV